MFNTRSTSTRDPVTGQWETTSAPYQPRKRGGAVKRFFLVGGGIVFGLMVVGSMAPKPPATQIAPVALATATTPAQFVPATTRAPAQAAAVAAPEMPASQKTFLQVVENGRREFNAGENDMAKGASRPHRKAALCNALHGGAQGWTGTIADLSSNGDGKGVLAITIAKDVTVKTWNNRLSDIGDHTLIEPDTAMYRQLVTMKKGAKVTFTGSFFPSDSDCVEEASLTQSGSMTDPEFIVRFTDVRPQ